MENRSPLWMFESLEHLAELNTPQYAPALRCLSENLKSSNTHLEIRQRKVAIWDGGCGPHTESKMELLKVSSFLNRYYALLLFVPPPQLPTTSEHRRNLVGTFLFFF